MKVNIPLPFDLHADPEEFWTMDAVREVGATVEQAGYHAGLVTDHPAPTGRWLDSGGHLAHGPLVMLSMFAAHTSTVKLQTGIIVLPYRNPFILARDAATLDRFSNGRLILSFGAGYLKGEYRALGVPFDKRNDLMDDYLVALDKALSQEEFQHEGDGYIAFGNRILPGPVQRPRPPMLVGGNAPRAIRRAVELADGWNPFFTAAPIQAKDAAGNTTQGAVNTTRTFAMEGEEDLKRGIDYMLAHADKIGRKDPPQVVLGGIARPGTKPSPQELVDLIGRYAALGVSAVGLPIDGKTRSEWCDNAARMGEDVVAKVRDL